MADKPQVSEAATPRRLSRRQKHHVGMKPLRELGVLVSQLNRSRNTLLPDLICLTDAFKTLCFRYFDGEVVASELENEKNIDPYHSYA